MSRPLTRAQVAALATDLRKLLEQLESGDIRATKPMKYRIEGAIAVLEVVIGRSPKFEPGCGAPETISDPQGDRGAKGLSADSG